MSKEAERFSLEDITKAFKAGADWQEGGTILYPDLNGYIQSLSTKEENIFDHNYAKEKDNLLIDQKLIEKITEFGHLKIGDKSYYERELVLHAIGQFSKKAVSDYKSSLIERLEEEMKKVGVDWEGNRDLEILEDLLKQ